MSSELLDHVGWTLPAALEILGPLSLVGEPRPEEFRVLEFDEPPQLSRLESDGWLAGQGCLNVRYARIQSPAADIATLMVYPTGSPELLPVFATEWVVVRNRCHALILDVETAGNHPALRASLAATFGPICGRWKQSFPENRELPDWFRELVTPWAMHGSASLEQMRDLECAYREYLEALVDRHCLPVLHEARAGVEHAEIRNYKEHHLEHFPGRPFLASKIGPEWTERFLGEWHFGPAGGA